MNVAQGKTIIDGSGAWNNNNFANRAANGFQPEHAVDGDLTDTFQAGYWLGRQGSSTEFFVVDLGSPTLVETISLMNTHNAQFGDRSTRDFQIRASNNLGDITGAVSTADVILSGKLSASQGAAGDTQIPLEQFNSANGLQVGSYQFVRFETLSGSFTTSVGLNELQVHDENLGGNVAAGKNIVDGSGAWQNNAFNVGQFAAGNVTDQRLDDLGENVGGGPGGTGGTTSFWLGREGQVNEFFTVDLEDTFRIDRIDLQNTHNRQFNDRGTEDFIIEASIDGVNFFEVFNDTLADVGGLGLDIPIESFSVANGDFGSFDAQFIRFTATSLRSGQRSVGLNEIFVIGNAIPEPGTAALALLGLGALGVRRRRRQAA